MRENTDHYQLKFETLDGEIVEVDEGMFDVLLELKRLGVETHYSCQGDDVFGAYVLGTAKTFRPVIRKLLTMRYIPHGRAFVEGYRYREFAHIKYREGIVAAIKLSRGVKGTQRYSIEHTWSPYYGGRTTLRWPTSETKAVLELFKQM